jgi:hypothetical protein
MAVGKEQALGKGGLIVGQGPDLAGQLDLFGRYQGTNG